MLKHKAVTICFKATTNLLDAVFKCSKMQNKTQHNKTQ